MNLDLMFYINKKEFDERSDLTFVNGAQMSYLANATEYKLYFTQSLDRDTDGSLYNNHYLKLSSALNKYKPTPKKNAALRYLRPEFVFIFQNNSGRGLQKRFQPGVLFHPLRHQRPKFTIDIGLGCLYDWSSWEVNNLEKILKRPPELQEKILFVNSHSKLRKDSYFDYSEWRPTLFVTFTYQPNEIFKLSGMTSYQQSLVSPFNDEIKAAYPELGKVYPYTYSHWAFSAKIAKGFSLKTTLVIDYENNNISIQDSSWEYRISFGVSWNFPGANKEK